MATDPEKEPSPPGNERGLAHVIAAMSYSFGGFKQMMQETAFRQEVAAICIILVLFAVFEASATDYLIALILFLILVAVEALNTGLEYIVNEVSPEFSNFAKHTKDLGSFAVFCLLTANGVFALYVIIRGIFPDSL